MRYLEKDIRVNYPAGAKKDAYQPILCCYLQNRSEDIPCSDKRPGVVICPGGAYAYRSDQEGEPVAMRFLSAGMQAFVLQYSAAPSQYPCAFLELAASVALIRENCQEWNVDPEKIMVCGFSAGGHLAASLGTMWKESFISYALERENYQWKPDGMILCYPVISMKEYGHAECRRNLLGDRSFDLASDQSLQNRVSHDTVPAFIWCTQEDEQVPMENSLLLAAALCSCRIPLELHVYEKGEHGLALCDETTQNRPSRFVPDNAGWIDCAVRWIRRR